MNGVPATAKVAATVKIAAAMLTRDSRTAEGPPARLAAPPRCRVSGAVRLSVIGMPVFQRR